MSILEESTGVKMNSGDWGRAEAQCSSEGPNVVATKPEKFSIFDQNHKVLVLDSGTLLAVQHKNYIRPETFFILPSRLSSDCKQKSPIFLAVSKGEFCLHCEMDKEKKQPSLQLKKKKLSHLATQKKNIEPFIFYRTEVGFRNSLESAAHPGWFISTCHHGEPVEMTNKRGQKRCTEFSFEPIDKVEMSPTEISE
ncbi:interleukin-37 [Saccopteryx leptura]|uniref:interleukin-37 n=1 Tax=Saccopteryx leptura TaxID=249018 RepID=UPI00339CB8C6